MVMVGGFPVLLGSQWCGCGFMVVEGCGYGCDRRERERERESKMNKINK